MKVSVEAVLDRIVLIFLKVPIWHRCDPDHIICVDMIKTENIYITQYFKMYVICPLCMLHVLCLFSMYFVIMLGVVSLSDMSDNCLT